MAKPIESSAEYESFCRGELADPYPFLHRLRTEDPVHFCEPWGCWIVSRYEDVLQAHLNGHLSSDKARAKMRAVPPDMRHRVGLLGDHLARWVSHTDPPDHTRLRALVNEAFTPRMVHAMRDRIAAIADTLIDRVQPHGRMDLIADFAYPMPVTVMCEMLGIPPDDRKQFSLWIGDIVAFIDGPASQLGDVAEQAQESLLELTDYFNGIVARKRAAPRDARGGGRLRGVPRRPSASTTRRARI